MRRLVVRGLEARATPPAAALLEAIVALADDDTARRAGEALGRLREQGVEPAVEGIGTTVLERGWVLDVPAGAEAFAAAVRRPEERSARLLKLWLEPGDERLFAGGWTDPLDERRLEKERDRFAKAGDGTLGPELDAAGAAEAIDRLVRRAAELDAPLAEGVALIIAQLRRAAGSPDWPEFEVVTTPAPPSRRSR
jgi:hypothetical protein